MKLALITSKIRANIISSTFEDQIRKSSSVLDIGCGTGVVLNELFRKFSIKNVVGCDIENYLIPKIKFKLQKYPDKLPFHDNTFDLTMFNDVLHHIPYSVQKKVLVESLRVGKKTIVFELIPETINKIGDIILNKIHNPNMSVPFTYRSLKEWQKVFEELKINHKFASVQKRPLYPFNHIGFILSR